MIYSNLPGIGKSAPQSVLNSVGADVIVTPLAFPPQMLSGHIKRGAIFAAVYEELPLFDDGYDAVLERLMTMQRMGLSTQQSILLLGVDEHVQLRQALNKDFWRAWASLGGRVELFMKGDLQRALETLELTVPVFTAEQQFLQALPGIDARRAKELLEDFGNRPILPLLASIHQNELSDGGFDTQACRNFVGLGDKDYLIQGEYK